jgi:hypothetical protein
MFCGVDPAPLTDNHGVAGETEALIDTGEPVLLICTDWGGIGVDELPVNVSDGADDVSNVALVTISVTGTETNPFAEFGAVTNTVP